MNDLSPPVRRRGETTVPMINVVFLLLIFFLMTAQITPPEPFDVTPPEAMSETPAQGARIFYVGADGAFGFEGAMGDAALAALAGWRGEEALSLRADRGVKAEVIAELLPRLAQHGVRQVKLISAQR